VLLVAPRKDAGPLYRHGYATLKLDCAERRLPVDVKPLAPATPGAEVEIEVATAPRAEVTLAVVDQAVLSLVECAEPRPARVLLGAPSLRVDTFETRSDLAQIRPLDVRGKKGRPGGDGGGGPNVRRKFVGTAYWNPCILAGDDGLARARFTLPDNLTRWRVVAVASSGDRWGAGSNRVRDRKPLMVTSAFPRFALLGGLLRGPPGRPQSHGHRRPRDRRVRWRDARGRDPRRPLRSAGVPDSSGAARLPPFQGSRHARRARGPARDHAPDPSAGRERDRAPLGRADGDIEIPLPEMDHVQSLTLDLGLSEAVFMEAELKRLLEYPHGCVEQTTSKTLPLLVLRQLHIDGAEKFIDAGVKRLLSMQTSSGGLALLARRRDAPPRGERLRDACARARRAGGPRRPRSRSGPRARLR
jgi:hypothetical protein